MKGIPWHIFPTAFSSCPSALSRDSSPAKTNKTQALMSHCKNSLGDKVIRGGFVKIQREATLQGVNHCRGQGLGPWNQAWLGFVRTSLVVQTVKRLSMMWETRVRSLGWEDPLEKEMAIHSSTIAWKIPWTEKPGRLQSMGSQRVGRD